MVLRCSLGWAKKSPHPIGIFEMARAGWPGPPGSWVKEFHTPPVGPSTPLVGSLAPRQLDRTPYVRDGFSALEVRCQRWGYVLPKMHLWFHLWQRGCQGWNQRCIFGNCVAKDGTKDASLARLYAKDASLARIDAKDASLATAIASLS